MARKLDPNAIKERIKENTVTMKTSKKVILDAVNKAVKGDVEELDTARKALSSFIKAAKAIHQDKPKLELVK